MAPRDSLDYTAQGARKAYRLFLQSWEYQKLRSAKMRAKISWNFTRDTDTGVVRFSHPNSARMAYPDDNLVMELKPILGRIVTYELEKA